MAIFPLIGCMIPLRTTWDKRVFFGVHLYQKDPKFVQKWLSYGHFPPQRLCDFIENYMWQKGILCCSIVPKWSKLGQELAELWPFSPWEVAWFNWERHGTKGDPFVFIWNKKDPKSVRKWLAICQSYCHFLPERLRDSIENHMGLRWILLFSFLPKGSKTSQEIAEIWNFPTERLRDSI